MNTLKELRTFIILWLTQALSSLGSSMTGFALVIWLYNGSGSALTTAMLTVCSYAPYVIVSIFAGAISDKWNKKAVMLVCDSFAALTTVCVLVLFKTGSLEVWHLYILNALNRSYELGSVACFRCCCDDSHARKALSENKRNAVFFKFARFDLDSRSCGCDSLLCRT